MAVSPTQPGLTWVLFACFVLFPFKRSAELPLLIMAVGGVILIWKNHRILCRTSSAKVFTALFACIWLPIVTSLPDSYGPSKSIGTALSFVRLYLAGIYVIWILSQERQANFFARLLAILAAIWVADALIQALTGTNLLGFSPAGTRINGFFGETNPKLGNALPVIAPFLILSLRERPVLMLVAAIITGAVVILAGSRGGWVSYGVVCIWLIFSETQRRCVPLRNTAMVALLAALIGSLAVLQFPAAQQRLDQTLLLFSGDEEKVDQALSNRWTLWKGVATMVEAHPVNGVGARAFRYAYPRFSPPDDPFISHEQQSQRKTGAFYAHQIAAEVLTETGAIGLTGLGLFYWLLIRNWWRAEAQIRTRTLPFAMGLLAWVFPFNTHPSFYSAQWSIMIWLMIAMWCAILFPLTDKPHHASA